MDSLKGYYFHSFIYCLSLYPISYLLSLISYLLSYLYPLSYLLSYLLSPIPYPISYPLSPILSPTYQTKIIYKYQRHIDICKAKKQTPKRLQRAWIFLKRILWDCWSKRKAKKPKLPHESGQHRIASPHGFFQKLRGFAHSIAKHTSPHTTPCRHRPPVIFDYLQL